MKRFRVGLVGTLAVLLGLAGSTFPVLASQAAPSVTAATKKADWTVMIYDVADTENISGAMINNLKAFTTLPAMKNVNVIVLLDPPTPGTKNFPNGFTLPGVQLTGSTQLLQLQQGSYKVLKDYGELQMGDPSVLANFIDTATSKFPASKYGLVLGDHGGAYLGGYYDETAPESHLDLPSMRNGIAAGMAKAGISKLDFIDHASCIMSNYEAASALAPLAKSLGGSEEVMITNDQQMPSTFSPEAIALLANNPTGAEVTAASGEAYAKHWDELEPQIAGFTAMSAVDGAKMQLLNRAVEQFARTAAKHMDKIAPAVALARSESLEFVNGASNLIDGTDGVDVGYDLVDLGDFLKHLDGMPSDVEAARKAVLSALTTTVTSLVTRQGTEQATGLNVYLPKNGKRLGSYAQDGVPPGWLAFLQAFAKAQAGGGKGGGTAATFTSKQARVLEQGSGGIKIAGQLGSGQEKNVTDKFTGVITTVAGKRSLALLLPAYLNAGAAGAVQGVWNYALTGIFDGDRPVYGSTEYQAQSGGLLGTLFAQYRSPQGQTQDIRIKILLSSAGEVQSVTATEADNDGGTADVQLDNGGTLTPYIYVSQNGSFQLTLSSQSVKVSDQLAFGYTKLARGTAFDMNVYVQDLAGKTSSAGVSGKVQ